MGFNFEKQSSDTGRTHIITQNKQKQMPSSLNDFVWSPFSFTGRGDGLVLTGLGKAVGGKFLHGTQIRTVRLPLFRAAERVYHPGTHAADKASITHSHFSHRVTGGPPEHERRDLPNVTFKGQQRGPRKEPHLWMLM